MKTIEINNNEFRLLPEKAIHWVEEETLLIADLHLGKSDTFRNAGIYIPTGSTKNDLDKLNKIIQLCRIKRIIFLGDLFHHKTGYNSKIKSSLENWRKENKKLELILVRGNHDFKTGDPDESLEFICMNEPFLFSGFEFRHFPPKKNNNYCFSGHIHPSVILKGSGNQYMRLPCFYFSEMYSILPSFGSFTGSSKLRAKAGDKVFVISEDKVIEISDRII